MSSLETPFLYKRRLSKNLNGDKKENEEGWVVESFDPIIHRQLSDEHRLIILKVFFQRNFLSDKNCTGITDLVEISFDRNFQSDKNCIVSEECIQPEEPKVIVFMMLSDEECQKEKDDVEKKKEPAKIQ
ncbi:hypothetical protein K1719_003330 [Acacia pycnantha]|nr:hypothetical protein K1719_003330 [Acacia pycnantha]